MCFSDISSELSSLPSTNIDTAGLNSSILDSLAPSDRISVRGVSYIKATALAGSVRSANTSWIWEHGTELIAVKNQRKFWLCSLCKTTFVKKGTDHIERHLRTRHRVTKSGQSNTTSVLEQQQRGSTFSSLVSRVNYDAFHTTLIHWIVCMHIPFSIVENTFFQNFISTISSTIASMLPLDGDTIRGWIMGEFQLKKAEIKRSLHISKSLIHFSFDLWTSPNALAMLGIVAHYMDNLGKNYTVLIGLRRLRGPHSGENMAQLVIEIIVEYDIADKIGCFVLDNASSNDTCVEIVLCKLRLDLNPVHRCYSCALHCYYYNTLHAVYKLLTL